MQLKQVIRIGSPLAVISVKKREDGGVVSEDDGLPCSPPEYSTIHNPQSTILTTSSQRVWLLPAWLPKPWNFLQVCEMI